MDARKLMTEREKLLVRQLDCAYISKYRKIPHTDLDLVYFLGDSIEFSTTWSAHSRKVPTFRKNPAKFLHRASMRYMTDFDKCACLGFPVTDEMAHEMGTTRFPARDVERSATLAGNGMHVSNCTIALLVGLVCFRMKETPSLPKAE